MGKNQSSITNENVSNINNRYFNELRAKLIDFVWLWREELKIEKSHLTKYHDSTRIFMDSIDRHIESIALSCCNFFYGEDSKNIFEASGTCGLGYDIINTETHKGVEVKSCNLIQNVICSCGHKYNPLINSICPACGSSDRLERKDNRFNIDAKETIRQVKRNLFDRFIFIMINSINSDIENGEVNLILTVDTVSLSENEFYQLKNIDGTDKTINLKDIRLEYFKNQLEKGKKAYCNLLPNSFDYYKLCPTRLCDIKVSFNFKETLCSSSINVDINVINRGLSTPKDILRKKEIEFLEDYLKKEKESDIDFFNEYLINACTDISYDSALFSIILPYRQKFLGKNRGDTTINKDMTLLS